MDLAAGQYKLANLAKMNVILGKNGSGKSRLLQGLEPDTGDTAVGRKKYVTPERGGVLSYEGNIEQTMMQNPGWLADTRRVNQFGQFRQQTIAQFRRLELAVLRESEAKGEVASFDSYMARINSLLDNIELQRDEATFRIHSRASGEAIVPAAISSGEAELISLGIEILMFAHELEDGKENVLLLDSPDVHLHPDLQARFARFLTTTADERGFRVVAATHSTAFLGGLSDYSDAAIAFMRPGDTELELGPITDIHRRVLPVFGAHPLSNIFNEDPVLVVEGDDDVRIWQQAIKTAEGALALYPVACHGVAELTDYEREVDDIVQAVYEEGRAFSLRDGDGISEQPDDIDSIIRMRLACRSAENLLMTDDVLSVAGVTWDELVKRMRAWIDANPEHPRCQSMISFRDGGFDRMQHDLKDIRMLLVGAIIASNKPWEVLVGQTIGRRVRAGSGSESDHSLDAYLGPKASEHLSRSRVRESVRT